jgi:hypothetical protein
VVADGLNYQASRRPKIGDIVHSLTRIIRAIDHPDTNEAPKIVKMDSGSEIGQPSEHLESPKVEEVSKQAEPIKTPNEDVHQPTTEEVDSKNQLPGETVVKTAAKNEEEMNVELKEEVTDDPKSEVPAVKTSTRTDANADGLMESEDDFGSVEKTFSPVFSEYLERERLRRESQVLEEDIAREDIDDFRDVTDIEESYTENSPWPFFSVLIIGAFCISGSLFYWALE